MQNAFADSLIGRLRDELLNETLFRSLSYARAVLDAWRADQSASLTARLDEPGLLRCEPAVRCASLHRRLRSADHVVTAQQASSTARLQSNNNWGQALLVNQLEPNRRSWTWPYI